MSTYVGAPIAAISPRRSSAESPPTTACIVTLARWLALLERFLTDRLILETSSEKAGWVV